MLVKDIMTSPIIGVHPETTVAEAVRCMLNHKISGLPVTDAAGELVGVLSEGDLLRRVELGTERRAEHWYSNLFNAGGFAHAYTTANARTVRDIMSRDPVTVTAGARLEEAVTLMEHHRVKRLPVMDGGKVVGIISRSDFLRALAPFVAPAYEEPPTSDHEIEQHVLAELKDQTWAARSSIQVEVKNGHVVLFGIVTDEQQRDAARVLAENVNGVLSVTDHLVWADPMALIGAV